MPAERECARACLFTVAAFLALDTRQPRGVVGSDDDASKLVALLGRTTGSGCSRSARPEQRVRRRCDLTDWVYHKKPNVLRLFFHFLIQMRRRAPPWAVEPRFSLPVRAHI